VLIGELAHVAEAALGEASRNMTVRVIATPAEAFLAIGAAALENSELTQLVKEGALARTPFAVHVVTKSGSVEVIPTDTTFPVRGTGAILGSAEPRLERAVSFAMVRAGEMTPLYELAFGPIPPSAAPEKLEVSVSWHLGCSPHFSAQLANSKMSVPVSRRMEYVEDCSQRLPPAEISEIAVY
jgi:hypothetical protein